MSVRRFLLLLGFAAMLLVPFSLSAQENPAPVVPNYERIDKETHRWFGEYRYKRLVRMFWNCDTTMTVDHFRCLYYGAALRGDTTYTLTSCQRRYDIISNIEDWTPSLLQTWWQLQGMIAAVWSSGDGTEEHPFHVATLADARFMRDDTGDSNVHCLLMGKPLWRTKEMTPRMGEGENLRVIDSLAMVRMGVLPDERQAALLREIADTWGESRDSLMQLLLATYATEEHRLWAELQVDAIGYWGPRQLRAAIARHRADTSAILADLYHRLAEEYYEYATELGCDSCFERARRCCDTAIARWPASDGAERCRRLRAVVMTPEVKMQNDNQQHISLLPASEWALTSLWHRNASHVWVQVYAFEDTLFTKPLRQWEMPVTDQGDNLFHDSYVYLPPMREGRYLLRASADSTFATWAEIEMVRCDRRLLSDDFGHGLVLDNITGRPIKGFKIALMDDDKVLATTRTDRLGRFRFNLPEFGCYSLRAMYKGMDIARGGYYYGYDQPDTLCFIDNLTLRDAYHAGDTVRFRCTMASTEGPVIYGQQKVILEDADGPDVDSLLLTIDAHGVGYGEFVLPNDSVTYNLWSSHNSVDFSYDTWPTEDDGSEEEDSVSKKLQCYIREYGTRSWDSLLFCYGGWWIDYIAMPVDAEVRLERLRMPQRHWLTPTGTRRVIAHSMDEEEFHRRYPFYAYNSLENNTNYWESDSLVFSDRRRFSAANHHGFALPPLEEGLYRATLTAYEADTVTDSYKLTLFSGRLPVVASPVTGWLDTTARQVGDTLAIHLETWLPDQQVVVTVHFNSHEAGSWLLHLSEEESVLRVPLTEEGLVRVNVNNVFHGETTEGVLYWTVGPFGEVMRSHRADLPDSFVAGPLKSVDARTYRHGIHRPALHYPARRRPLPYVWHWLGKERPRTIQIYDPGEYQPWIYFGDMIRLPR